MFLFFNCLRFFGNPQKSGIGNCYLFVICCAGPN